MTVLFIHQNFPAQYVHIVRRLAADPGNQVFFITQSDQGEIPGVHKLVYRADIPALSTCHPYVTSIDTAVRTGSAVALICRTLAEMRLIPDLIIGHCGWGETLFVKDVFPDVPLLSYFEFFYHARGADVGFDSEFAPCAADDESRLTVRNIVNRLSFASSDWGHTATRWQRSLFPEPLQQRMTCIHEGVDTERVCPDKTAWIRLARKDIVMTCQDQVLTYVSRNLEPYRGFHTFMRALPALLRRYPELHVVIVGGDGLSYSPPPPYGGCYREMLLHEVGSELDLDRIHFLGQVPYETYLNVLQISSAHVHLTYPFVLSWSFIEALSVGCLMIASATPPVLEALEDGENGFTVDFFSPEQVACRVSQALEDGDQMKWMREAARETAVTRYDLHSVALPEWENLMHTLVRGDLPEPQEIESGLGANLR